MNIKKQAFRTICAALACTTLLSSFALANATDVIVTESPMDASNGTDNWTTEESNFADIEVTYKQTSSYNVIIPKAISLDASKQAVYAIKVTGDIDVNQRVYVAPVDVISETANIDFYMKE